MKRYYKFPFLKAFLAAVCAAGLFAAFPAETSAWSPYTHGAITAEALQARPDLLPGAAYSSSIPDITTNFISPASKDRLYSVFHGRAFAEAAGSVMKGYDKFTRASSVRSAYGFLSHAAADPVAHADSGYPNAKATFRVKKELNHYTAYLFMDMICYQSYFGGYGASFGKLLAEADSDFIKKALDEYSRRTGEKVEAGDKFLAKKLATFTAGLAVEKAIFDCVIDDNPEMFEQIRSFYGDHYLGVGGRGGLLDAAGAASGSMIAESAPASAGDESKLRSFLNRQKNDLIYAGMSIASEVAQDTEFLRTGSLTSAKLRTLVDKFFANRSESSRAMGKLLSALLFRKDMTYEEIVAMIDGKPIAKIDDKFEKYRTAYKDAKTGRWYSFVPGTGLREKREYADAFAEYDAGRAEAAMDAACVDGADKARVMELVKRRGEAFRESYLASGLNPFGKASKAGKRDAAYACSNFALNYAVDRAMAKKAGDAALMAKLDRQARYFAESARARSNRAAKAALVDKVLGPRKSFYDSAFAVESKDLIPRIVPAAVLSAKTAASGRAASVSGRAADESEDEEAILAEASKLGLEKPSTAAGAYESMKKAYEKYVAAAAGANADPDEVEAKLKAYVFYKSCYEKLCSGGRKAEEK